MYTRQCALTGDVRILSENVQLAVNTSVCVSFACSIVNLVNNIVSLVYNDWVLLDVRTFVISLAFLSYSLNNLQMAEDIIRTTQREVLNRYNFADYHPLSDNPYGNSKAIGLLRTIENLKKKEDNECSNGTSTEEYLKAGEMIVSLVGRAAKIFVVN